MEKVDRMQLSRIGRMGKKTWRKENTASAICRIIKVRIYSVQATQQNNS